MKHVISLIVLTASAFVWVSASMGDPWKDESGARQRFYRHWDDDWEDRREDWQDRKEEWQERQRERIEEYREWEEDRLEEWREREEDRQEAIREWQEKRRDEWRESRDFYFRNDPRYSPGYHRYYDDRGYYLRVPPGAYPYRSHYRGRVYVEPRHYYYSPGYNRGANVGSRLGARIGGAIAGREGAAIGSQIGAEVGAEVDR